MVRRIGRVSREGKVMGRKLWYGVLMMSMLAAACGPGSVVGSFDDSAGVTQTPTTLSQSTSSVVAGFSDSDRARRVRVQMVNDGIAEVAQDVEITEEMIEGLSDESFGVYQSRWIDVEDGHRFKIGLWTGHPDFELVRDRTQGFIDSLVDDGLLEVGDAVLVFFEFGRNEVLEAKAAFTKEFRGDSRPIAYSLDETTMRLNVIAEESEIENAQRFASRFPAGMVQITLVDEVPKVVLQ